MNTHEKGSRPAAFSFFDGNSNAPLPGLAASAASRLPRWALIALVLLYVGHGLVHRDPWRGDDVMGIALARSVIEAIWSGDIGALFMPYLQGFAVNGPGPLWAAISALFMLPVYLWSALQQTPLAIGLLDDLARIPLGISLLIGLTAIWKATDRFARRREAQPVDPLGVGPKSQDFGKTLADCALLLTTATLGVIYPWHQAGTASVSFMLLALLLWSFATAPETPKRAGRQSGIILAAGLLTHGLGLATTIVLAMVLVFSFVGPYQLVAREFYRRCFTTAGLIVGIWIGLSLLTNPWDRVTQWWVAGVSQWWLLKWLTNPVSLLSISSWANDSLWKWWPLWPIAAFGLWNARKTALLKAPHWAVPLLFVVATICAGLIGPTEWKVHQLLPIAPLALIAAFGLLSLPRPIVNLVDWFAVVLFTALGVFIWLYWSALNFGFPETLANRVPLLAPGVKGNANVYEVFIGITATLAWIGLVSWRVRRGNPRLWRPVVLSAGGLTLVWVLLMTLWIPAIDRIQGQATLASSLTSGWVRAAEVKLEIPATEVRRALANRRHGQTSLKATSPTSCIRLSGESANLDAMAVAMTPLPIANKVDCIWQLALFNPNQIRAVDQTARLEADRAATLPRWKIVWQSSVGEDRRSRDRYVLLERIDSR